MMRTDFIYKEEFFTKYENAIKNFISDGSETELNIAYQLGRNALDSGKTISSAFLVHSKIISEILSEDNNEDQKEKTFDAISQFFLEFLSPFEMTFKGLNEIILNLKTEINVRQSAVKAYKQSEKYYKALISNALDIFTILDSKGVMKYYSTAVEKILGYSGDELIGKNAFAYVHPDDVDNVLEIFSKTSGIPEYTATVEFRFLHKNGDWVILEAIGKNLLEDPVINGIIVNSRDITDRRNLEEARRKYEFIANASNELLSIVNRDYRYEAVNDAYCKIYYLNRTDIIGKKVEEILGKDIFDNILKHRINECFNDKVVVYEGWVNIPKRGKRFLEITLYPYKNKSSVVTHIVKVKRDITERREKEDEIKKNQLQLAEAQRIAHLGSWEWISDSDMVFCSEEFCSILGIDSQYYQIQFKEFLKFIHPGNRQDFVNCFYSALRKNEPFTLEHRIITNSGEVRIIQTRGKTIENSSDISIRIIGTSQDITEQEAARQALKSSEIKYRRLFETSKEGLVLIEAETGEIFDVNPYIIDFLGYTKSDFIGKKLWELNAAKAKPETEKAFRNILNKDYARFTELDLLSVDNSILFVEFISIKYSINNHYLIQCHFWDITERKYLIDEINRAIKQRAEDMRSFANSVQLAQEEERRRISRELHDDICQRLTALKFHINIFEDAVHDKKKISLTRLGAVKKEINNLINEVRTISSNLRPSALDHFGLVTALKLLCSEFKKTNGLAVYFESNIETFNRYEPNIEIGLYRITQEALSNCIKHTNVKEVFVKIEEGNSRLDLSVKDNGAGFNTKEFFNHSEKTAGHFGLINMHERTELMGGKFNIISQPGKGTIVSVIVPLIKIAKDEKD